MCPQSPPVLLLPLLLLLALGPRGWGCPPGCQCSQPRTVFCTARKGPTVPHDVPPDTAGLYIFENGITTLDVGSFAGLPGLQLLDLSQNQIASLPGGVFQPLANLSNLDLSANRLREVTNETFRGLWRLERLYLGKNRIRRIEPGAFAALHHLLELKLQDNELRALPPLRLPRLLLLDLSHNSLSELGPGALDAGNLEALRLAGLGLRRLDEGLLGPLQNLRDLDVSDNQLERVPPAVHSLRGLTRLRLAGNPRIAQLRPEDLAGLAALQELDLSNLSLQALPSDLPSLFPRLRLLTAARNPFNCVCPLSWFGQWVRESRVTLASPEETRCHFPPKNAGRLLLQLDYADFGCPATTTTTTTTAPTTRPTVGEPPPSPSSEAPTWLSPTELATPAPSQPIGPLPTARSAPQPQDCPASTCLNGGTCHLKAWRHLACLCPEGFTGLYCESRVRLWTRPSPLPATPMPPRPLPLGVEPVSPTSLRVALQHYLQSSVPLTRLRLTYRNLSGPDKRPVTLRLPAWLAEYTVTQLQPNATYSICVRALGAGQGPEDEEACGEARTPPAIRSNHAPVTQAREGNLPLLIAPTLAAVFLAVLAAVGAAYCVRRGRAAAAAQGKGQVGPGAGPLELEGVKAALEPGAKVTEGGGQAPAGGPECEVLLMGYPGPGLQGPLPAKPYI
ncbi:vasorin [Orycteropus afer afer]|uniref:Vasorin n=1 Tax=Orycteropus afer afer TaxID=1230840 RepID=A0A8B6ZPY4_ORYAF|nr:vasorin [Orycteropus afer afer]